jgi:hypothetical protein
VASDEGHALCTGLLRATCSRPRSHRSGFLGEGRSARRSRTLPAEAEPVTDDGNMNGDIRHGIDPY